MAFPGTYNITYYKGDSLEFRVYPKDAAGGAFPLSQYVNPLGVTKFTIAPTRGATSGIIEGYAAISNDQTYILCAITPSNGASMTPGTTYVYDVEIARSSTPYSYVYTLLTGNITVSEQVTPPGVLTLPSNPTSLVLESVTSNTISISWTEPTSGGTPEGYKIYILPFTTDPIIIGAALAGTPTDTETFGTSSYTFTGLSASTNYLVGVRSYNDVGDAPVETVLTNLLTLGYETDPEAS